MVDDIPETGEPESHASEPGWQNSKLTSWKRIAHYLQCGERTARRWRDEDGLPVHNNGAAAQSPVFAYAEELDQWLAQRAAMGAAAGARPASAASVAETASRGGTSRRPPIWLMGVWAFGIGVFALIVFLSMSSSAPWAPKSNDNLSLRASNRVAVATFENLAPQDFANDKAQTFEENLRAALAAHNIEMVARAVADEAGESEFVVTGAFHRDDAGAVINVQIIKKAEGAVLWAGGVVNRDGDFDAAQTHAAAHIVGVLSCTLDFRKNDVALPDKALANLARFCEANRSQELRANSMFYAEQVLAAAPESATANGLMGASLGISANWTDRLVGEQRESARARARTYVEKAIAIDADNPVAKVAQIFTQYPPENWALIEQRFLDALSEENSEYIASLMYARFLSKVGRTNDAIHAYRLTLAREPLDVLSINARVEYAALLAMTGDLENARLHYDRALSENPGWAQTHDEYLMSELFYGDPMGAEARISAMLGDQPDAVRPGAREQACYLVFAEARQSMKSFGGNRREEIAEKCRDAGIIQVRIFAALGADDLAFDAVDGQSDSAEIMAWSFGPEIDAMRHDPRYRAAAEKAGLVAYWRDTGNRPDFCRGYDFPLAYCREFLKEI